MAKAAIVLMRQVINDGKEDERKKERNRFLPPVTNRPSEPNESQRGECCIDERIGQTHFVKGPGRRENPHVCPGVENSPQGLAGVPKRAILDHLGSLALLLRHVCRLSQSLEFLQLSQVGSRGFVPIRWAARIAAVSD